jgi:exosortase
VSGYLIFSDRKRLLSVTPSSDLMGVTVLILALVIHIAATMGDINFLSGFSILLYLVGASLFLCGREITKLIAFPLGYLVFMFPIPDNFLNIVALPSKSLATAVGLKLIDIMGIPYFREGFLIHLPETTLVVGTPCNGMQSLLSFLAIGSLFLYSMDMRRWMGLLLLLSIYPMAVFLNGCRVAILVYVAYHYGIDKAAPESPFHTLSGMAVFVSGLIVFIILIKLGELKRRMPPQNGVADKKA